MSSVLRIRDFDTAEKPYIAQSTVKATAQEILKQRISLIPKAEQEKLLAIGEDILGPVDQGLRSEFQPWQWQTVSTANARIQRRLVKQLEVYDPADVRDVWEYNARRHGGWDAVAMISLSRGESKGKGRAEHEGRERSSSLSSVTTPSTSQSSSLCGMRVITQDQDRKTLSAANIEDTAGDVDIRLKEDRHDATVVDHPSTTRSLADSVITLSDSDSGLEYFPDRDDLLEAPATLKRKEPPSRTVQPSGSSKRVKGDVVSDQLPAITVKHEHFDVDIKPERGPSKGYRRPTAGDPNRAWTPQQHYEVIKGIIDVASRAGGHWDVITQAVQAHSPPGVVRTQNIIKKTWVTTEKPRLGETLSSQGRLFTLKDLPAQTRGSERAWNQAEKRSLWTGIVRAGSRMCDWVKITNEVNKAGAVPRTVDQVKKTFTETLRKKYA